MKNEKLIAQALKRFRAAESAERSIREEALLDHQFLAGEQWPDDVRLQREMDGRPCLVSNRLPQFLRQVTNEQRKNKPAIQISPAESGTDAKKAEIMQGLIRHIEVASNASVAYNTATQGQATGGFGYVRVVTEYADPFSFEQQIRIKRIRNPFTVYFDPSAQELDYSDGKYCFIVDDMERDDFTREYPDSETASFDLQSIGDSAPGWLEKDSIRVAEYFRIETERRKLALIDGPDGRDQIVFAEEVPAGVQPRMTRWTDVPRVVWSKITACEELETESWPGEWIPVVPFLGEEIDVAGSRHLVGLIRNARDPQRMYNFWTSAATEAIALAPKIPYIGVEGQFEGYEHLWAASNTRNLPYLEYRPVSLNGTPAPPPQRQAVEAPIQAIMVALQQSSEDLKNTTGIYDPSLGARSNETSGKAILARQQQTDTTNFHFSDNGATAIQHIGRILVDLAQKIYSSARVVQILKPDDKQELVLINQMFVEGGRQKMYDLTTGRYDVTVSVGPSYQSKRQEAVASMLELTRSYPQMAQLAGDIMVESMDWPNHDRVAERLRKALPPELQESGEDQNAQKIPPQFKAQYAALAQQSEALMQALKEAQDTIATKRIEMDSRERIEALRIQADLVKTEAQLHATDGIEMLRAEIGMLQQRFNDLLTPDL